MREILFRGKAVGSLKWVEGFYFREAGNFIKELPSAVSAETHMVYEDTVGQYTGLTDKNGKKIFEGDIVKIYYTEPFCEIGYIKFDEDKARFVVLITGEGSYSIDNTFECVIIGNIHDNPDMLKGGGEG